METFETSSGSTQIPKAIFRFLSKYFELAFVARLGALLVCNSEASNQANIDSNFEVHDGEQLHRLEFRTSESASEYKRSLRWLFRAQIRCSNGV